MPFNTNTDIWFAGAFAACTVDLLLYPLDTLKTRIQSPEYKTLYKPQPAPSVASNASPKSALSSVRAILFPSHHFNTSLFRGLYQGASTVILVTIPSAGAFFNTYEALKSTISDRIPPNSTLYLPEPAIHAVSSAGAELVSCAILTPAEVLKQNAQVFRHQHDNTQPQSAAAHGRGKVGRSWSHSPTTEVLRQFRSHPTKLFRGYTTLAARNLPFVGLQFPLFERLKTHFLDRRKQKKKERSNGDEKVGVDGIFERTQITVMSAALAGTGAAWITTPIDVIKTRIMLGAGAEATRAGKKGNILPTQAEISPSRSSSSAPKHSQSAADVIRTVLRNEGIHGMFRGALLRSVWTAFGSGLYLGCYEGGRQYLKEKRERKSSNKAVDEGEEGGEWDETVARDWKNVKVGIGISRSQGEKVVKSRWQD